MTFMRSSSILLLALIAIPLAVSAAELRSGDQPSISAAEAITDDVYIAGGSVTSAGTLQQDIIAAGGNILISGSVGEDIAAAAGSITVLAGVGDDIRAAGGNIVVQGTVGGDAVLAGGQINLGGGGVSGDALIGGGTVRIDAPIEGDVWVGGGDIYLNAVITGDAVIRAEQLTLGPNARLQGNLTYTAAREATMEDGAVVMGETTFDRTPARISVAGVAALLTLALLGTFFAQLASALAIGLFFRRYALALSEESIAQPLLEVGRGLVTIIVLPVISIILLYTLIGIPLGLFGLVTFVGIILFLWMVTPIVLGSLAYRAFFKTDFTVDWKTILLGVFIWNVIGLIPIVGWLTQLILSLLTLGTAVKVKWRIAKEWR